jgi:hypothetical protein
VPASGRIAAPRRPGSDAFLKAGSGDILGCVFSYSACRLCCLCAIFALIPAGMCAPVAMAAGGGNGDSFNELTEGGKEETSPAEATTSTGSTEPLSSSSSSSLSTVMLVGLIAAGGLIAGIAFLIMRDARSVAPVPEGQVTGVARSGRDPAATMRRRRAKAKAARRQRKRNR